MSVPRGWHKWAIDFSLKQGSQYSQILPVGYSDKQSKDRQTATEQQTILTKKSWDVALGPIKQIPMNLFIMWMAGSTISIFPMMMVGMMFFRPIQALAQVKQTYKTLEGGQETLQTAVYILGNCVCLALAVYKCYVMGLLPTEKSDWLAFEEPQQRMEWSGGGMVL